MKMDSKAVVQAAQAYRLAHDSETAALAQAKTATEYAQQCSAAAKEAWTHLRNVVEGRIGKIGEP